MRGLRQTPFRHILCDTGVHIGLNIILEISMISTEYKVPGTGRSNRLRVRTLAGAARAE